MGSYRKGSETVEARQVKEPETLESLSCWCPGLTGSMDTISDSMWVEVPTGNGGACADYGDWITRGGDGNLEVLKKDVFDATYEPVEDE